MKYRSHEAMCHSCRCSRKASDTLYHGKRPKLCEKGPYSYTATKKMVMVWTLAAVGIVVIINQVVKQVMERIVVFEKTHTVARLALSPAC